jgi:uncharacterized RDD family membrane protein YckC
VTTPDPPAPAPEPDAETARVPLEPPSPPEPDVQPEPGPDPDAEPGPPPAAGIISAKPVGWTGPAQDAAGGSSAGGPVVAWPTPAAKSPATVSDGVVIAGIFSRLVAYSVDLLLLGSVDLIVSGLLGFDRTGDAVPALVVTAGLVVVDLAYFVGFWSSPWQATVGMRLLKLRVLGATTAGTLSVNDAVLRWLALTGAISIIAVVPGLGQYIGWITLLWGVVLLITTGSNPIHQGLHDRWARSVVAQPAPGGSGLAFATCLFLAVLFLVVLPAALLLLVGPQLQDLLTRLGQSV